MAHGICEKTGEITYAQLVADGISVPNLVMKVLNGEGSAREEEFVLFKVNPLTTLSIALVRGW